MTVSKFEVKVMVVKEALLRRVSSLLRPWLLHEADLKFELGFFKCEGVLGASELDVSTLNEAFLQSSTLLIKSATVGSVHITFMPWRNPVLTLEINGLHIVMSPRPPDDEFWRKTNQQRTAEQEQKAALLHIDPLGSALHAATEKVTGIRPSRDLIVTLLTNMILQGAKIKLIDISVELLLAVKAPCGIPAELATVNNLNGCCFSVNSFIVEDGYYRQSHSPGGFLSAAMISVFFSCRGAEGSKICDIRDLGLELKKPEIIQLHSVEVHDKYIIFLQKLTVSVQLSNLQLSNLEFFIPEAKLGLCPRDLNELMIILKHLNLIAVDTVESVKYTQLIAEGRHVISGKDLWKRALEHVRRPTPRRRLEKLVETVILQRQYFQAYVSWLREVGWVPKEFQIGFRSNQVKNKGISSCIEGLSKEVCKMEKDLPVEAIALARRVARHKVLAQLQLENLEGESNNFRRKKIHLHLPLLQRFFSLPLRCLRKLVGGFNAFIVYLYNTLRNLVYYACSFLKKGFHCQSAGERSATMTQTRPFCSTKHDKKPCNFTGLYYRVDLCEVFITIRCNDINKMTVPGQIEGVSFSSIAGSSVELKLENLSLLYAANERNAVEFSLVCGELKGHIFSTSSNNKREGSGSRRIFYSSSNNKPEDSGSKSANQDSYSRERAGMDSSGRSSISSMCNAVLEKHQREMWSDWENKFVKYNMSASPTQSTATRKPFVLCEAKSFSVDPSLRNPNSGLLKCGLSVDKLFFDLDCSVIMYIVLLYLQLLDAFSWTSLNGSKKPSNSLDWSVTNSHCRDKRWEEFYELYTEKVRHAMLRVIPEKSIHLTAVIAGPKIQLSSSLTEYLEFQKQTTFSENDANFVFHIDFGNLEVAIWPADHIEALTFAEEHNRYNRFEPGHGWLKKLPQSDLSVRSDSDTGREQFGINAYLKLENAVVLLENRSECRRFSLVKPFTFTVQSSVCRDQCTSLTSMEKALMAAVSCTVSAVTVVCPVDELSFVFQVLEDRLKLLDIFLKFLVTARDVCSSRELHAESNILYGNREYLECISGKLVPHKFGMGNSPLLTSFAVVMTFDLESLDLPFGVSSRNLDGHGSREKGSGFRNGKHYKIRKEKQRVGNSWRWFDFPITDMRISFQNCVVEFSWGDKKQAQLFLKVSGIQAVVCDGAFEPCRNLRGQDMKAETSPVEATETHPKVLTQLIVRTSTFNVVGGPYVSEQMLLEKNVRTDIGSSSTSQIRYMSQSAECVLPFQTYKTQLNEPERNRCLDRYPAMDLLSPTSSCWLRVDIDLSECFLTDSSLEVLISEATLKLSGSKRMRALFEVGKGFQTVSGGAKGGFLVLQTGALATLMESYRAYQIFLKGFASRALSLPFVSSRQGSEPTSGVHGAHKKRPFIGTSSFKVQQFSSVLAHVDMSGGEQGFLVEMDLSTMFALENEREELSFDLSRLMILGIHPNRKVMKGKQQAGQIPRFGSTSFALRSNDAKKSVNLQLPSSATNLTGRNESYTSSDQVVWDTHSRRDATSSSYVSTSRDCHILECMTAQFSIARSLAVVDPCGWKWRGGWNGQCSISGVALTFTTSEILMLLSLTSPISELSSGDKASNLPTMGTCEDMSNDENELECKIPDGTIVAIKDVQEHLYLAVKSVEGKHQLCGVLHHTLVGAGAALFRVKHQAQGSWGKFQSWFSLLSLTAKNEDGEPYRVHCHPGSSLVDISSTNDKSCELWHAIPFKYKAEDDIEEHDIYGHLCKKWLHFINKKSGSSLAFVNARLQLVKKPGNPLKLKIFSPATLRNTLPFDTLPTNVSDRDGSLKLDPLEEETLITTVPRVKVIVNMFVITILYEASGAIHFFPLLRVYLDSAESVVQVSSHKFRIISTFKIGLESYEAQTDNWMEMLQKVEICIVYRARLVSIEEKDFVFKKPLISFYSILKQVDLFVREPSLDICLFLVGELNLGGPYTIRNSPVTANCCKVLNNTGLDLLCCFDDSMEAKIAAWHSESFLTRHMVSRKDSHPKSSMHMSLQLVKSGMVSSTPIQISLEQLGVTTLRTRLGSSQSKKRGPGPLVVVDVSKENEAGLSVTVSPMVRIHNQSGRLLELRCRRPQQRQGGAVVCLKHGDIIDDSMGAFDAFDMSGESKKALVSFGLGNYLLCVRPVNDEASFADGEISPSFEWSDDLKGVKAVCILGLFDKLSYHIKQTFYGQNAESGFSMIHCGLNSVGTKTKDLYFLVRTTKRKLSVGTLYTPEHPKPQSQIVALQEQQDILILPTIQVSNLLEMKIAVTSSDHLETNSGEISEQSSGNHAILKGGQKEYMYADLSKLFLTVTLYDLKQTSSPINAGDWGKFSNKSKGELHDLDIELDFGDGKHIAMLRLSRGDMGHLEVIIYTRYALQNDTDMRLICWASQQESFFMWKRNDKQAHESGNIIPFNPMSRISWFEKHDKILIRRVGEKAIASLLDLENFSGFMEISLVVQEETSFKDIVKMGINSQLSSSKRLEPTHTIHLVPRYIALNQSSENILVCQCDMQETANAVTELSPGQKAILHMKILAGEEKVVCPRDNIFNMRRVSGTDSSLFVQFSLKEPGWSWSGPICSASLGRFFLKMRSCSNSHDNSQLESFQEKRQPRFAVVDVKEERSSLIMHFEMQSPESLPYRIVNGLRKASIQFHQKELTETDTLEPGVTVGYVWDNLNLPHMLFVQVAGTQLQREISLDKLESCKHFYKNRQSGVGLSLLSGDHLEGIARYRGNDDRLTDEVDFSKVVYEVYADGPTRVLWVYEAHESHKKRDRLSQNQIPHTKIDCKVSHLGISLLERGKQQLEVPNVNNCYTPIIFVKFRSIALEFIITRKHTLCSFNVEKFVVEEKWHGAPFTAMLRVRGQDYFQRDEHVLHMFLIVSNNTSNPNQVKYSSVVLQALDLHLDEDTLMKLVPFYRSSLADSITPHRAIYFEHFEIHPIKIVASFLPGHPRANYTSAQETLRAFLHSIIKIPAVKGTVVELNGLLLSHALMTFHGLAIKCAQHYSWYMMRAIYIAKGSQLLPPSFVSLFDDSASTSFDFFIDPSDHQNFTKGMFDLVRKGIGNKEFSGTNRYFGDLGRTIKTAGSNVLFEAVREVSDNVMKGAETSGFNGMVHGFYRGILKLAMEPSVLGTAAVKGGYTYRIKLEQSADMDELYIEGYLQAMLDALFKQNYLRVKVVDDQVLLKNLPPNSVLMNEIKQCVKNFLIGEGLLAGESSQAVNSLRRLHGESERQVVPRLKAVCEQLFVIFAIRALRRQTEKILRMNDSNKKSSAEESSHDGREVALPGASKSNKDEEKIKQGIQITRRALGSFLISTAVAYVDGRLCRHIPNALVRRIVSGFLLSFVE